MILTHQHKTCQQENSLQEAAPRDSTSEMLLMDSVYNESRNAVCKVVKDKTDTQRYENPVKHAFDEDYPQAKKTTTHWTVALLKWMAFMGGQGKNKTLQKL